VPLTDRAGWNVMAHAQKPDSVFRRNGRVHLYRRGRQFSRLLAAEVCTSAFIVGSNAGYTMFRGSEKGTGYPLHSPVSPSLPLPCVILCHNISAELYSALRSRKVGNCTGSRGQSQSWVSECCVLPDRPEVCVRCFCTESSKLAHVSVLLAPAGIAHIWRYFCGIPQFLWQIPCYDLKLGNDRILPPSPAFYTSQLATQRFIMRNF